MKTCIAMMAALFVFSSLIYAVEFHSTTNGGDWMDVNTWQNPGTPGQDDDVFIHGTVDVNTSVFCNNLSVIGNESMLRGGLNSYCSINVGGNINSSGWITSSNYTFTVNLYGNLNVSYNFVPTYFNWLGSGNRTLSCGASYQGIKTRSTTTISATIDTIFALSDVYIAPGGTYTPQLSGNDHQVVLYLIDRETRTSFNLYSRSTKLKDLLIVGDGSSIFNFNNDSGLSEPTLQNCEMNNLTLTGIHNLYAGCTLRNVTNNGLIYNSSFSSCNLNHYGLLINNGQIGQAPHGYGLSIYSYGDIINAGLFNPSYLYLRGENPRVLQSTQSNPIKASGSISGISGLGDVYCGEQLYFANVSSFNGPVNLKAYTQSGQAKSIGFTNVKIYNSTITGIASSAMEGTDLWISNTPVSNLILQGSIYFTGNSTAYNITNHGTIQNGSTETGNLSIHGDFVNYGTIQSYPQSYNLIVYADANVLNYGTWTAYSLNLNGTEPQNICFGVNHPFAGSLFTDTNSQSPIHVVEEDLYIQASQMDLNNAPLYLNPGGFDLNLTGTSLYETEIISSLENNLNMSGNARISSVTLNSITNLGTMELISNTNLNGDLVNHGTIQNNNSSYHLNISGNLTNHGTIRSYGGYDLYVYLAGNASNYGVWNNYLLNLNGSQSQQIIFPSGHAFSGTSFVDSNETSSVTAIGDIYFQNCSLNFNSASLLLAEGADMILDNCNLYYAAVLSDLSSRLSMVNGGFVNYCSFQSITFAGLISLSSNTTIADTLVNTGIIQNQNSSNYLHVYGDLDNQGIIQNHPDGYYLYLYCYSNLVNSGTISCYRLNFSGTDAQTLSNTGFISVSLLYDTVSASSLELLSDLYLTNTILNLGGSVLILSGDTREGKILSLSGGYLSNASITGGNSSKLVMSNLANISNVSFDDIIWEGTIILNSTITVNNLINNATIMNYQNSSVSLDVYGRFDNSSTGILTNNTYYNFTLNAYGDVYNHGQLRNYEINFRSSENQFIYHSPEADTIRCSHFRKSNATGSLTMLSDLVLKACIVKFNHQDLIMEQGGTAYALNLYGAYLENIHLVSNALSRLFMGSDAYFAGGVTCGNQIWSGVMYINSVVNIASLVNQGSITNRSGNTAYMYVSGSIENYGQIYDNGSYPLYLYAYGDLLNYNYLGNRQLIFNGTGDQHIFQAADADTIQCTAIRKTVSTGDLILLSNLRLSNCYIFLNGRSLVMSSETWSYSLTMSGGYIESSILVSPANSVLNLSNNCYLNNLSGANHTFEGSVLLYGTCSFANIINNAYTRNLPGNSVYMNINGNLTNNGTFYSDNYPLYLQVTGFVHNYGTLSNKRIYLTGTLDQNVIFSGTQTIDYLTLNSNLGSVAWYHNGEATGFSGATLDLAMNHNQLYGTWQPYLASSNTWGRIVTINPTLALPAPQNLQVRTLDDILTLRWNQVSGAQYYKLYSSGNPYTGFSLLSASITDPDPADGIVELEVPMGETQQFYRVSAGN